MARLNWPPIIAEAARIIQSYNIPVILRQVHYRLFAAGMIPNTPNAYNRLGRLTAAARRFEYPPFNNAYGAFPYLADHGRGIDRPFSFDGLADARDWLLDNYRLDRAASQPVAVYLGCEKATLSGLLRDWFDDEGLPVVATRGQSGQALVDDLIAEVAAEIRLDDKARGRKRVLLWIGDFDPSGLAIPQNFARRVGLFDEVRRIAVQPEHVAALPVDTLSPAKPDDPNQPAFIDECRRQGIAQMGWMTTKAGLQIPAFPQVEAEAIDPAALRTMITDAVDTYWDDVAYRRTLRSEQKDLKVIRRDWTV